MFLALAALVELGCGRGSGTYRDGEYRDDETAFRVGELGPGWSRLDVGGQNDIAFISDASGAVIQANASCSPELDIPLIALRNHLLIGFTERETESEQLIELDGREALETHVRAKLDGVPRELLLTVLKKNECVYDLALAASPSAFAGARTAYESFRSGFHTEGRRVE